MLLGHRPGTTSESSLITVSHAPFRPVLSPAPRPVSMSSRKKIIFPAPDAFVFLSSQNRRCGAAPPATHILIEKAVACRALRHRPAAEAILSLPCPHRISPPPRRFCHYPALNPVGATTRRPCRQKDSGGLSRRRTVMPDFPAGALVGATIGRPHSRYPADTASMRKQKNAGENFLSCVVSHWFKPW